MQAILLGIAGFVISGLVFRILASIGFTLITAKFINSTINDYIATSFNHLNGGLTADISGLLNIARIDDCLSVWVNAILFVATYKSLKFIFVRTK